MADEKSEEISIGTKLLMAGTAACIADFVTFPLDTAKVRMQISGESRAILMSSSEGSVLAVKAVQPGLIQTITTLVKNEGFRKLYGGLSAGLQRQMCFASVRLGLYDSTKIIYADFFQGKSNKEQALHDAPIGAGVRILAGMTTGALAVLLAQPTDVVKVRMQAGNSLKYASTLQAYKNIAVHEGVKGLWRGTFPNVTRNVIINVAEIVCYDIVKDELLKSGIFSNGVPCHLTAAIVAGFCATLTASPVDVVKTRYMNSKPGEYKSGIDTALRMLHNEGPTCFYKGFVPSFTRLVSWNIVLWLTYEQIQLHTKH
ncbi:mitochondrial uncoupling protein 2-like [Trichogramma pretiosum]|uniref:mitochondrial uncoupling protein 2-like n=1 Tax=Trichogramma pretiosum TaxID=7493 RepID=UPI0006C9CFD6|nr:mitochondrial uncoupling protein 2-like [Trichogramma pretiosum]